MNRRRQELMKFYEWLIDFGDADDVSQAFKDMRVDDFIENNEAENLPISDVSDLLPYLGEIKERIVYRLQQEFPNAHDLVKSIVEDQFENIDNKVAGNSR